MTKESIYKNFLEDPLLFEKKLLSPEKAACLKIAEPTKIKLLEVIKIAINGNVDRESESLVSRKINQYLNK